MATYIARGLYSGDTASSYDHIRTARPSVRRRWRREMGAIERIVQSFPQHSRVLDLPCGTGRFHPLLAQYGCEVVGADISLDMMHEARLGAQRQSRKSQLVACDAEQLPFPDRWFDYLLCMRFYNIVPSATAASMLREAARVTKRTVIVQVRFEGHHPLLRMVSDLRKSFDASFKTRPAPNSTKRFPLPEFDDFVETARSAGLTIARLHHVGSPLEADPLRICELERR